MSEEKKDSGGARKKLIGSSEAMLIFIFVIAGGGVAITDMSPNWGYWFWLGLVPLLALTSLYRSWASERRREDGMFWTLRVQILHWFGLLGALEIVYLLYTFTNRIDAAQSGLVSLLVVALSTFLAGIHFHWHFAVLGIMLALSTLAMAWVEAFVWIVIPLVFIAVSIVLFFTHRSKKDSPV